MKATYNKTKIMRNAWYLKKVQPSMSFSASLKKAWRNEKLAMMTRRVENRPMGAAEGRRIPPAATGSSCGLLRKQQNVLRRLTQIKYDHERHN